MSVLPKQPPAIPLNAERCLVCRSLQLARHPVSYSQCRWLFLENPRTGPFCGETCRKEWSRMSLDRQMVAIFGDLPRALYLAKLIELGKIKAGA